MFLWYNHPSSCTEVNCLMLLASYFSQPSWLTLIDPLKRDHGPFVSLDVLFFFSRHGTSFLCWVQGWIVRLEHKTLFHGTPTMHLWTPCYAWTTDAEPQRDTRAASKGAGWPWPSEFLGNSTLIPSTLVSGVRIQSSLHAARLPTGQKIFWQRLFPFSNDYDFVLFGTSVGFMLVLRDSLIVEKKAKLDRPNQSSIWRIWWCCNCTSCRAKMSLPLNKHTSSWLPVCSCKHARKSFLSTQKKNNRGKNCMQF